jgi:hypothetical protein
VLTVFMPVSRFIGLVIKLSISCDIFVSPFPAGSTFRDGEGQRGCQSAAAVTCWISTQGGKQSDGGVKTVVVSFSSQ